MLTSLGDDFGNIWILIYLVQVVLVTYSGGEEGTAALPASLEEYRCVKLLCLGHMLIVRFV